MDWVVFALLIVSGIVVGVGLSFVVFRPQIRKMFKTIQESDNPPHDKAGDDGSVRRKTAIKIGLAALGLAAMLMPEVANAQSLTLDIDVQPLFDAINNYIPVFFGLLSIAGGITIALLIARFIINAISDAFSGRRL